MIPGSGAKPTICFKNGVEKVLEAENITLSIQLEVSNDSVKQLMLSVDDQNKSIEKFKSDSDVRLSAHQAELLVAKNSRNMAELKASRLLATVVPVGVNDCTASNNLVNEELK